MSVRLHAATDDLDVIMKYLTSSAAYFAMVFGAGFVFGTVRVMWFVPMVGVRVAELAEIPLMLAVIVVTARSVNRRFLAGRDRYSRLIVGVMALVLLLLAELILGVMFLGLTPTDVFLGRDPVSGTGYYLSLCALALMPWFLGGRASRTLRGVATSSSCRGGPTRTRSSRVRARSSTPAASNVRHERTRR